MNRGSAMTDRASGRVCAGSLAALLAVAGIGWTGCSSSGTVATSTPSTVAGPTVNLRSTGQQSSAAAAVALWKQLRAAGTAATITGYDQNRRFSLTTSDPDRVRQVVAGLSSTTTAGCRPSATLSVEESATPPDAQPGPATDRATAVARTTAPIAAGTDGTAAYGGSSVEKIQIRADERPATAVVTPNEVQGKVLAADVGPGLIIVQELFADPALDRIPARPGRNDDDC